MASVASVGSLASCPSISSNSTTNQKSVPMIPVSNLHHLHSGHGRSIESDEVASVETHRSISRNLPQTGQTKKLLGVGQSVSTRSSLIKETKEAKEAKEAKEESKKKHLKVVQYRPMSARPATAKLG